MANARAAAQLGSYSDQIAASLATAGFTAPGQGEKARASKAARDWHALVNTYKTGAAKKTWAKRSTVQQRWDEAGSGPGSYSDAVRRCVEVNSQTAAYRAAASTKGKVKGVLRASPSSRRMRKVEARAAELLDAAAEQLDTAAEQLDAAAEATSGPAPTLASPLFASPHAASGGFHGPTWTSEPPHRPQMQFENSMDLDMDEDLDTLATQSPTSGRTQHQKDEETAAAEAKAASTMEAATLETTKKMQEIEAASTVEENAQRSTSAEALHGYKTGFKPIPDARDLKQMLEMVMPIAVGADWETGSGENSGAVMDLVDAQKLGLPGCNC